MTPTQVPPYNDLLWPALQAVIELGGSASVGELDAAVTDREKFSPEVQGVLHGDGPSTEIQYRLAWARTYLKGMGLLTNSQRGIWSVTEKGRQVTEADIKPLHAEFAAENRKRSNAKKPTSRPNIDGQIDQIEAEVEADWKDTPGNTARDVAASVRAFGTTAATRIGVLQRSVYGPDRRWRNRRPWRVPDFAPELSCVLPVQAALRERDPITPSTPPSVAMRRQTPMRPHAEPSPRSTARVKCDDWNGFSRRSLIVVVRRGGVRSELKEPVAFGTHQLFGVKRTTKAAPP